MSDYGDQGSNDTKSEAAASPLTAELNNGALHPTAAGTAVRHHPSSCPPATGTAGVDRGGQSPQFGGPSPLMYPGSQRQLHALSSLVEAGRSGCPSLTAGAGLDDDGGFLAMNVAAAAAAAACAGSFNLGYNRL